MSSSDVVEVTAKWQSTSQTFPFPLSATVRDLHSHIALLFNLAPTLKLIGLVKGRLPPPSALLSSLSLPPSLRLSVIGTRAEDVSELTALDAAFSAKRVEEERRGEERRRQREAQQRMEEELRLQQEVQQAERQRAYQAQQVERERQWREEQARLEVERKERELKEEQAGGDVSFTLNALRSDEADSKGKLILPPSALQTLVNAKVAFPLSFVVRPAQRTEAEENKDEGGDGSMKARDAVVYLGVSDFDSPAPSVVLVPSSLLRTLQVEDGAALLLSTFTPPKATHISLLPLPSASTTPPSPSPFYRLSPPERTALLEFHLRHHQLLTRGQVIDVQYRRGMELMRFEVKDVQPGDVVSIIDADVETEVEGVEMEKDEKADVEGGEEEHLQLGEEVEGSARKGDYHYWRAELDDANAEYEVAVKSVKADADVYLGMKERTSERPSSTSFDWRGVEVGDDRVLLSSDDPRFRTGELVVAVHAYDGDAQFRLSISKRARASSSSSSLSTSSSSSSSTTTAPLVDVRLCDNCHKAIPVRSLAMHELQCRRNNSACPHCSLVLPTRQLTKHVAMQHTPVACSACSERMVLPLMAVHRRETCVGRLVECQYCPLLITAGERGEHSSVDGLFRSACRECGEVLQRKVMRRHMRLQHGRNEKDITWRDFF